MKLNFSPMAIQILEKRYLLKNKEGTITETPEELLERVAKYVCGEDKKLLAAVLKLMKELKFLPNTPTLMNAGTTNMLSACFAIPVLDSLESIIHEALWQQAAIHKKGGGTGLNFSLLRPKGDTISSTGGVTCGVLSFMENFDTMSKSIQQGGKRAGANMSILSIYHPEIEEFIKIKTTNSTDYENMNLSVLVDDMFMLAVKNDKMIALSFPIKTVKGIRKQISAKYLWDLICDSAHKCGCPGILFEDTINSNNTLDKHGFHITTTNPCGEQPLFCGEYNGKPSAESCNLGSLNILKFVNDTKTGMDYKKLEEAVLVATAFLDRVIDKNVYPFKFIEEGTKLTRKIGLGVTGFSDYLIKIEVPYNSERAITEAEEIMKFITNKAHLESFDLAAEFGKYPLAELIGDKKRNNMCTTIAPTGTIGRLMLGHGYSSGIEPPFAVYMKSNIIETTIEDGIHPLLLEKLEEIYFDTPDIKLRIIEQIKQNGSSIQNISQLGNKIKKLFLTSNEIPVEQHIKIQAAFQSYTDNAVSKTINLHNSATVSEVSKSFMLAYDLGCKGTTIYRDGSKNNQVLNSIKETQKTISVESFKDLAPRPAILPALSFVKQTACNTLFINPTYMGVIDKSALEHFIDAHGGCLAMRTGLAMSVSLYQRIIEEINPEYARNALQIVTTHLLKVECPVCKMKIRDEKQRIKNGEVVEEPVDSISCPNALAQVMDYMLKHKVETYIDGIKFKAELYKIKSYEGIEVVDQKRCPDCGTVLIKQGGCTSFQCPICLTGGCN